MNPLHPSEDELQAWIDGRLDAARQPEVEAWLRAHPERAAVLNAQREDMRRLRGALAGLDALPANPALDPAAIHRDLRQRRQRQWATAAMLVLSLGLGGVGGWQARDARLWADNPPMQDAVQAHRLFAAAPVSDLDTREPLAQWLASHFAGAPALPDLASYGLHPVGARLLANESGPAALLVFSDAEGHRLSLFVRSPGEHFRRMPSGERTEGELQAQYWAEGNYNLALVSAKDDPRTTRLRQALEL